jgi:hypothetical protein
MSDHSLNPAINGPTAGDSAHLFDTTSLQTNLPAPPPQDVDIDIREEPETGRDNTAGEGDDTGAIDATGKDDAIGGDDEMVDAPPADPNAPRKRKAVSPVPSIGEDEEMQDADARDLEERIFFDRSKAPAELRDELVRLDIEHYPDSYYIGHMGPGDGEVVQVPMEDIFALRGGDSNKRFLPEDLGEGGRALTMVEMKCGVAGRHLETSLAEAKQKDEEQPPAPPSQSKGKGKAKQQASIPASTPAKPAAPPKDECVKAKFHLDTQTPHIEITTIDPDTGNILSTRIWAYEFAWLGAQPWLGFGIQQVQPTTDVMDVPDHYPAWRMDIDAMASLKKTTVVRASIALLSGRRRFWDGISESSLAAIRAKPDLTKVRDLLITGMDTETEFGLYFSSHAGQGRLTKWTQKLDSYFRNLLMVAKDYGNFWFWRQQCEKSGEGPEAIEKPALPKATNITPRWLGTEWTAIRITDRFRNVRYKDLQLHKWAPLEFPNSYEDVNEAAFLLKLSAREERDTQRRQIRELVRSDGTRYFRARFNCVNKTPWQYSVEVYLGMTLADARLRVPAPGTRIQLSVDKNNAVPPKKEDLVALKGQVVFDAADTDATFVCVVDSGRQLPCADTGADYPVYIDYIIDDLPYERQIRAIAELQLPERDMAGPDAKKLILGCQRKTPDTDVLKQLTFKEPTHLDKFRQTLRKDFAYPPNATQEKAALHTTTSDGGSTVIIGPPGTGKTNTVIQIAMAHGSLDRRVMLTAPTNAAVHNLVDVFGKHNGRLPQDKRVPDHEWVYFTGAHSSPKAASKLMDRQLQGEAELAAKNNAYLAHLRDAKLRDKAPRFEQTFGYKLSQRIKYWSEHPETDDATDKLHTWSVEYLALVAQAPYMMDRDMQKRARVHLESLEAWLSAAFFKNVRYCFCTLSTSAHDLVLESGLWAELIIDEAARETRAGIATALGALRGRVAHVTFSGDHMQGEGIIIGQDSNVGYKYLARNVFEEVANITVKREEKSMPLDVFTLDTGYRMSKGLYKWPSEVCYGGLVQSHPSAAEYNQPLRETLRAFWAQRTRKGFSDKYEQISLDVNAKAELQEGSTTYFNTAEAEEAAYLIKEMLLFDPPKDTVATKYCRVRGKHFIVISNYIGQVAEIRKALRNHAKGQENVKREDIDAVTVMLGTTSAHQGREADIAIYSMCIGNGTTRLAKDDKLGLGFVAYTKNYNVSITRQRVARYIIGSYKLLVQAYKDGHPLVHRHADVFKHIKWLYENDHIIGSEERAIWKETGQAPPETEAFATKLIAKAVFVGAPMSGPSTVHPPAYDINSGSGVAGLPKSVFKKPEPSGVEFAGARNKKGTLKAPVAPVAPEPAAKKQKNRGVKDRLKRQNRGQGGDDDGAAGASASAA